MASFRLVAFATAAALWATPSFSLDFDLTPAPTRMLIDSTYLPLKGQLEGLTDYSVSQYKADWTAYSAVSTSHKLTQLDQTAFQSFRYGLTDTVSIIIGSQYDWVNAKSKYVTGTESTSFSGTFSNPTFGLTWRMIDQQHRKPISLDVIANFTPGVIPRSSVTESVEQGDISSRLSRQMKSLTVAGTVGSHIWSESSTRMSNGTISTFTQRHAYYLAANSAYRPMSLIQVNLGGNYYFNSDYDRTLSTTGYDYTIHKANTADVHTDLSVDIVKNRLVGLIGYHHTFYDKQPHLDGNSPTRYGIWTNQSDNLLLVNLRYVFF